MDFPFSTFKMAINIINFVKLYLVSYKIKIKYIVAMISDDPVVVITDLEIPAVAEMFCKGTVFAYNIRWTLALHCLINSLNSVYHMYVHLIIRNMD